MDSQRCITKHSVQLCIIGVKIFVGGVTGRQVTSDNFKIEWYLSREICITWVGLKDQLLVIKPILGCLNICLVSGLLMLTLWAVGFSYAKWERNHCEQPSAFPSSMCEFVMPHIWCQFHLSIYFLLEVFVQKNANFLPKALTKEWFIPSWKYCIHLVFGLHIKPKFKAFLPSLVLVCWACWTQHSRPSSKQQFETMQSTAGL